MKKTSLILFLLSLLLIPFLFHFFISNPATLFNKVVVKDKFEVYLPDYLKPSNDIDTSALLQYKNEQEQIFLLIYEVKDSLNTPLLSIFKAQVNRIVSATQRGTLNRYYPETINEYDAFTGDIYGYVNNTRAYYRLIVLQHNNVFFKILFGMNSEKKQLFKQDIGKSIASFLVYP